LTTKVTYQIGNTFEQGGFARSAYP
jgi:hypothetical protein